MHESISYIFVIQLVALAFFILIFLVYSYLEDEKQVVKKALFVLFFTGLLLTANTFNVFQETLQLAFVIIFTSFLILIFLPFGNKKVHFEIPRIKTDERDIMFSRNELLKGTEKFRSYYQLRPENEIKDDVFRSNPGLLSPESKLYHPLYFNAAAASFATVGLLNPLVEKNKSASYANKCTNSEISEFIKKWALKLGAESVGFTLLKPHHIYSHIGRGENYGAEVNLDHKYAIAFTVEMSHESMRYSPQGPVIAESAQQYLKAGTIAVQLAEFLRNSGFEARAHIDANYRVICPVVAMDAGLGTIGRMGLLMTPKQGPRVRIGVVTTNLEIETNKNPVDSSMVLFCESCKKCAVNCPSDAISFQTAKNGQTYSRWTINHEACFTYWTKIGTDCGRCISVCPYAHKNNFIHNMVKYFIKINSFNRWLALKSENYFYGKKTPVKTVSACMSSHIC